MHCILSSDLLAFCLNSFRHARTIQPRVSVQTAVDTGILPTLWLGLKAGGQQSDSWCGKRKICCTGVGPEWCHGGLWVHGYREYAQYIGTKTLKWVLTSLTRALYTLEGAPYTLQTTWFACLWLHMYVNASWDRDSSRRKASPDSANVSNFWYHNVKVLWVNDVNRNTVKRVSLSEISQPSWYWNTWHACLWDGRECTNACIHVHTDLHFVLGKQHEGTEGCEKIGWDGRQGNKQRASDCKQISQHRNKTVEVDYHKLWCYRTLSSM